MAYYLPILTITNSESIAVSVKEAYGKFVQGFPYMEFSLGSQRVLLQSKSAYVDLHHIGQFCIFTKVNHIDWVKKPVAYVMVENPSKVSYSWRSQDWQGAGHRVSNKTSEYEIIPIGIGSDRVSFDLEIQGQRTMLLFDDPNWVIIDPNVHDAIYALEY